MNQSLGIIGGIIAMIGWGTADFFVAMAVRKSTLFQTVIWTQLFGVVIYFLIFALFFKLPALSPSTIGIILLTGFLSTFSYVGLYKALQVGKVAIVSPVAACWVVMVVILSLIFLHESLEPLQTFAVILAVTGVVVSSFKLKDLLSLRFSNAATGIPYALISVVTTGVAFILMDVLVTELHWFFPIFFTRIAMTFYMAIYGVSAKKNIAFPKNITLFLVLISTAEAVGMLAYGMGINNEFSAVVAPIAATFPMVTIILARIFFKEKLVTNQKIGVAAILTGLVLLAIK